MVYGALCEFSVKYTKKEEQSKKSQLRRNKDIEIGSKVEILHSKVKDEGEDKDKSRNNSEFR